MDPIPLTQTVTPDILTAVPVLPGRTVPCTEIGTYARVGPGDHKGLGFCQMDGTLL